MGNVTHLIKFVYVYVLQNERKTRSFDPYYITRTSIFSYVTLRTVKNDPCLLSAQFARPKKEFVAFRIILSVPQCGQA